MGPVSQRVTINRTIDINRNSMANRVLRKPAIIATICDTGPSTELYIHLRFE